MSVKDFCTRLHVRDVIGSDGRGGTEQEEYQESSGTCYSVEEPTLKVTPLPCAQIDLSSVNGEGVVMSGDTLEFRLFE